jgi:large subunit ribosomal protein L30
MSEQTNGQLKITLIRSSIGRPADQGNAAKSLGLRRLHHSVIREDNPSIRGQVNKISHLVSVE